TQRLDLIAGLIGVSQRDDGAVEAAAGWLVRQSRPHVDELIARLRDAGIPERPAREGEIEGPAEIIGLYSVFDGGALPFGLTLRRDLELRYGFHEIAQQYYYAPVNLVVFADLPNGSSLAFAECNRDTCHRRGVIHIPASGTAADSGKQQIRLTCSEK